MSFYRMADDGTVEFYKVPRQSIFDGTIQPPYWTPSRQFRGKNLTMIKRFREVDEGYIMLHVM